MKRHSIFFSALVIAFLGHAFTGFAQESLEQQAAQQVKDTDLWFFVLVKSSNYSQDAEGELSFLNYHFFSELFAKQPGLIKSAKLKREVGQELPFDYVDRGEAFYYEGGHFKSVAGLDAAHPNGNYHFNIELHSGKTWQTSMLLSGSAGETDIPEPIHIYLHQDGKAVRPDAVDPGLDLTVSWSSYSNGAPDPKGIVDDMIFVVFQDCTGKRVFHTGLPFKEPSYMTYRTTEVAVPRDRFESGHPYAMFVEFPHRVDSVVIDGTPGFASYATATYLDVRTTGTSVSQCPEKAPPLDTGQTDRMDVELN